MPLTPEDIEKVRTKQLANLIRKAQSGTPLTGPQLAQLEALAGKAPGAGSSAFVKTQDELAEALGITRKTVTNCLRRFKSHAVHPVPKTRADGRYDITAWAAFLRYHNIARKAEGEPATSPPGDGADAANEPQTVTDWKQQKLRLECRRIELETAKVEGQLVEVGDLEGQLGVMLSAFRTALNNLPGRAAQKLVGLRDYHQIHGILQKEVDVSLRTLEACRFILEATPTVEGAPIGDLDAAQSWDDVAGAAVPVKRKGTRAKVTQGKLPKVKKKRSADRASLKGKPSRLEARRSQARK